MKYLLSLGITLWALFTFAGCSDMINSLRQENIDIDKEAERDRDDREGEVYGYKPKNLKGVSANNVKDYDAGIKRDYGRRLSSLSNAGPAAGGTEAIPEHRATRADFVDAVASENSLWDGQGQNNYLFSNNRKRENGDLVSADVEKELRREIQFQLWMTLPPDQRRVKRAPASSEPQLDADGKPIPKDPAKAAEEAKQAAKPAEEKAKDAAEEAAKTNLAANGKDDDLVRMEVVENVGNGLVRMVGQKRVIYRGVSRVVEVMALVNNKDIDDNNRVKSSAFLDMQTQVVQ
jgi:flagellar basal body L-ring protein FlgH